MPQAGTPRNRGFNDKAQGTMRRMSYSMRAWKRKRLRVSEP